MATPKVPGMTPNTLSAFAGVSPLMTHSPAALAAALRARGSPANLTLANFGNTPNTAAAVAEVTAALNAGFGRDVRFLNFLKEQNGFGMGLPQDENKMKKELEDILKLLALKPGRISEEGIERLAKRMGLECHSDSTSGVYTRSLSGKIIVVDIEFNNNNITNVALSFANTLGPSSELAHLAAAILYKDLNPPDKSPLTSDLTDFAGNLERLAKLDKLSSLPSLNCFTAVTGIYESLLHVAEYERQTLGGEIEAQCKGHGIPKMHSIGKVGLSIEYWKSRRKIRRQDGQKDKSNPRLLLEIDDFGRDFMSLDPVRISSTWVPSPPNPITTTKPNEDSVFGDDDVIIDWQDPDASVESLMEIDSGSEAVSARFVVRLDPPVVVPLLDEVEIYNGIGILNPPGFIDATTLDGLVLNKPMTDLGPYESAQTVYAPGGASEGVKYKFTLYTNTSRQIYSRTVYEIPFSHPKQLFPMLQIFRQYTFVRALLKSIFTPVPIPTATSAPPPPPPPVPTKSTKKKFPSLEHFLSNTKTTKGPEVDAVPVTVSITHIPPTVPTTTTSTPSLNSSTSSNPIATNTGSVIEISLIFPNKMMDKLLHVDVEVSRNGGVNARYDVVNVRKEEEEEGEGEDFQKQKGPSNEQLTTVVEVTEDLGIVVEWLSGRV